VSSNSSHKPGDESVPGQLSRTPGGGILYDAARLSRPTDELFEREHWAARGALEEFAGGRGSIAMLRAGEQHWVLRHYRRGGWAARLSADRYCWLGAARTRSFAEWCLLVRLRRLGLPVPPPIAARYVRGVFTYRADLITEYLGSTQTLADAITGTELPDARWAEVGGTIAAFHRQGVQHVDLNANNILLSTAPEARDPVHVLDFDRGRIRARGRWEEAVLKRLRRSLHKILRTRPQARFSEANWRALMQGYRSRA
jgi:3-deoxy-D-manno-octulosonic acid kinase